MFGRRCRGLFRNSNINRGEDFRCGASAAPRFEEAVYAIMSGLTF